MSERVPSPTKKPTVENPTQRSNRPFPQSQREKLTKKKTTPHRPTQYPSDRSLYTRNFNDDRKSGNVEPESSTGSSRPRLVGLHAPGATEPQQLRIGGPELLGPPGFRLRQLNFGRRLPLSPAHLHSSPPLSQPL